jgi:hypothetical protein
LTVHALYVRAENVLSPLVVLVHLTIGAAHAERLPPVPHDANADAPPVADRGR